MRFQASPECIALIQRFEGLRLKAYLCPAGYWTIGWGHTDAVREGQVIDKAKALELRDADVESTAAQLDALFPPDLTFTQGQQDALISLCFNLAGGPRALPKKAPKLFGDLLRGEKPQAAHEFLDMDHALQNGKPVELAGLKARRLAEAALFLQ